jgi:hypothetical protein
MLFSKRLRSISPLRLVVVLCLRDSKPSSRSIIDLCGSWNTHKRRQQLEDCLMQHRCMCNIQCHIVGKRSNAKIWMGTMHNYRARYLNSFPSNRMFRPLDGKQILQRNKIRYAKSFILEYTSEF